MSYDIKNLAGTTIFTDGSATTAAQAVGTAHSAFTALNGADLHAESFASGSFAGVILPGASLAGADLSDADFSGANLYGADLSTANLTGADLRKAVLVGAKLTGANLEGTKLTGAYLGPRTASEQADLISALGANWSSS